ncbi:MAG TPA: YfiR family protein [Gammaproteobacteria bacterium]|nr:YfiR family protein [Gammaproteobacteria bacterium]
MMRIHSRTIHLLILFFSIISYGGISYAASSEYDLKAAFIEKFLHFIKWPAGSTAYEDETGFTICIAGINPFKGSLEQAARLSRFNNNAIQVKQVAEYDKITDCHVLFISSTSDIKLKKILALTKGQPILTISDSPGYAVDGVIINFYPRNKSLGFEINRQAAVAAQITISSRLLKLANIVEPSGDKL